MAPPSYTQELEKLQDQIRALYAVQRQRYRRGEIDDPFDADARPRCTDQSIVWIFWSRLG